ncbi:DNA-directed RNA polymerase subunit beta [Acrasis kona]|uniref:DNA-directed RNA polymerase subunit beta n=1 Tax=Acrasis kona TaxID=1008807 RepID=A0AAW2Z3X0_9EUKA
MDDEGDEWDNNFDVEEEEEVLEQETSVPVVGAPVQRRPKKVQDEEAEQKVHLAQLNRVADQYIALTKKELLKELEKEDDGAMQYLDEQDTENKEFEEFEDEDWLHEVQSIQNNAKKKEKSN